MTDQTNPAIVEIAFSIPSDVAPLIIGLSRKDKDFEADVHLFPTQAGIAASVRLDMENRIYISAAIEHALEMASDEIADQIEALALDLVVPEPWKITFVNIEQSLIALATPIGPDEDTLVTA